MNEVQVVVDVALELSDRISHCFCEMENAPTPKIAEAEDHVEDVEQTGLEGAIGDEVVLDGSKYEEFVELDHVIDVRLGFQLLEKLIIRFVDLDKKGKK